jgi:peptide/nickel transport system substrate-binding protein
VLYTEPELQAYVKGRFDGFVRQPAEIGPVIYQQTSPTYALLKPASASGGGGDDGGGSGAIIAIVAVVVLGGVVALVMTRRRRTAYERE